MIPEGWHELKLGNFVSLQRGYDLTAEERRPGNVPVAGSSGINGWHDTANVKGPGVTLGRSGASFGVANYYSVDFWAHNTAMFVTDFHGNDVLFAYHFLDYFNFDRYNSGGAQPSLNRNFIYPIRIAIPSLSEQRKIAGILSTWDEAIRLTQALIAGKQQRKKGLMQRLLTGQVRFPEFAERPWREVAFSEILDLQIGRTPSRKNPRYWDGDKKTTNVWLSIADLKGKIVTDSAEYISDEGVAASRSKLVPANTVVMSFKLTIGRTAILGVSAFTNEAICSLIPRDETVLSPEYLFYALGVVDFDKEIDLAVKGKTLNTGKIERLKLLLPSVEEQQRITEVLNACDCEIQLLQQKLAALQQQKKGLMQRLLTGDLRVPPVPGKGQTANPP